MKDYVIAIPTHRRRRILEEQTLKYLNQTNVDMGRVTLFLSDRRDSEDYRDLDVKKITTKAGNVQAKFNFIHNHYPVGTPVFLMEDDVEIIRGLKRGTNETKTCCDLDKLIRRGFECVGLGGIFGVAPHSNAFFFTHKETPTLKLVVAFAFGFISTRREDLEVSAPSKTDYERTCKYWLRYGETWRLDSYGVQTKSYNQEGGIQAEMGSDVRAEKEQEACDYLVKTYPTLCAHKPKRSSPFAEIKFKSQAISKGVRLKEYRARRR